MTAIRLEVVTIKGELTAWHERREGWGFGELRTTQGKAGDDHVTFTGKVHVARVGDTVELTGIWTESERYGLQFKVRQCTVARPESTDGIVAWLASTLPDVGETRARALVERFGAKLWDVIEASPDRLTEVGGITAARVEAIVAAYRAHRADRDHMICLRGWGLTDNQIARCIQTWGALTMVVERVHENPYELCEYVHGFGFLRADKVATKAGIARDAPARIGAGVEHILAEAAGAGHCFMSGAQLQKMAAKLLGVDLDLVARAILVAANSGRVVRRQWRVYPRGLDDAEDQCAVLLGRLLAVAPAASNVVSLLAHRAAKGNQS